ncbi:MAG TPA: type 4a pilus biogenesis protein PilO [Kofleriaceae bacterium]
MQDFARLPNQRKAMIFIVAGFLMFLLYYQFVFKPLNNSVSQAEGEHDSKVAANHKADADIKTFNELKPAVNRLKAQIDQNEKALPTEAELPAFFDTLNRKVTESGVTVNRSQQQPEAPIESFIRVPVDFEIQGTFMQIKKFFASLVPKKKKSSSVVDPANQDSVEERERIVSIDNLVIGDPQVKNREMVLTARFTANTYRQEEKTEPNTPKTSKPAATPTPAPATGSATTPPPALPPAATPAGAKARANDAMKKDEVRSGSDAQRLKGGL